MGDYGGGGGSGRVAATTIYRALLLRFLGVMDRLL